MHYFYRFLMVNQNCMFFRATHNENASHESKLYHQEVHIARYIITITVDDIKASFFHFPSNFSHVIVPLFFYVKPQSKLMCNRLIDCFLSSLLLVHEFFRCQCSSVSLNNCVIEIYFPLCSVHMDKQQDKLLLPKHSQAELFL